MQRPALREIVFHKPTKISTYVKNDFYYILVLTSVQIYIPIGIRSQFGNTLIRTNNSKTVHFLTTFFLSISFNWFVIAFLILLFFVYLCTLCLLFNALILFWMFCISCNWTGLLNDQRNHPLNIPALVPNRPVY